MHMTDTKELTLHPKTGRPVLPHATFEVGDLVTEHILSDDYPGVVTHVTPKTVWVQRVRFIGNFSDGDQPGYSGYGDSGSIVIDPESVDLALSCGKVGAKKYVLYVNPRPTRGSLADEERFGGTHHRSTWRQPGSNYTGLSHGARFRQDPHV